MDVPPKRIFEATLDAVFRYIFTTGTEMRKVGIVAVCSIRANCVKKATNGRNSLEKIIWSPSPDTFS
jgi:hypothetical protein